MDDAYSLSAFISVRDSSKAVRDTELTVMKCGAVSPYILFRLRVSEGWEDGWTNGMSRFVPLPFIAQKNIQDAAPTIDDLLQRLNSTVLEVQIMSHDATVTATELYIHLHMLCRRSVLESLAVNLP